MGLTQLDGTPEPPPPPGVSQRLPPGHQGPACALPALRSRVTRADVHVTPPVHPAPRRCCPPPAPTASRSQTPGSLTEVSRPWGLRTASTFTHCDAPAASWRNSRPRLPPVNPVCLLTCGRAAHLLARAPRRKGSREPAPAPSTPFCSLNSASSSAQVPDFNFIWAVNLFSHLGKHSRGGHGLAQAPVPDFCSPLASSSQRSPCRDPLRRRAGR